MEVFHYVYYCSREDVVPTALLRPLLQHSYVLSRSTFCGNVSRGIMLPVSFATSRDLLPLRLVSAFYADVTLVLRVDLIW